MTAGCGGESSMLSVKREEYGDEEAAAAAGSAHAGADVDFAAAVSTAIWADTDFDAVSAAIWADVDFAAVSTAV